MGVIAIASFLLVIAVSLVITRVATVVLVASGMSRQHARFQSRSAFTGTGFTTSEAESVLNHPLRRKVVMLLMLLGTPVREETAKLYLIWKTLTRANAAGATTASSSMRPTAPTVAPRDLPASSMPPTHTGSR